MIAFAIFVLIQFCLLLLVAKGTRRSKNNGQNTACLTLALFSAYMLSFACMAAAFVCFAWSIDEHSTMLWAGICMASIVIGFFSTRPRQHMPVIAHISSILLSIQTIAVLLLTGTSHTEIADPVLRTLFVAPAAMILCTYFGGSIALLLWHEKTADIHMGYEAWMGRRFLLSKASPVLSVVTAISMFGVALGVWLVIMALGVLGGFEDDLQKKIIGAGAHCVVQQQGGWPFALPKEKLERPKAIDGLLAMAPFVEGEVAIASQSNYTGSLLFGIDPKQSEHVLTVLEHMELGTIAPLNLDLNQTRKTTIEPQDQQLDHSFASPASISHIVIGKEMANMLNIHVGDSVRVISPVLEEMTPIGMVPKSLDFRVAGIFASKMYEFDARYAYIPLTSAQKFFELDAHEVHGLQIAATRPNLSEHVGNAVRTWLAPLVTTKRSLEALDWKQRNQTLFSALKLERVVAFVVLVFIILVASFSIVSTLSMSIIEKRKEIAILKTMGARRSGIMKVFLVQGLTVGILGTMLGTAAALVSIVLLQKIGFGIPGEVYYIDALPVHIGVMDIALIVFAALLIVWDFSIFPAIRAAQMDPVEGLRDG